MSKRAPPSLGNYTIVCPHCKKQEDHNLTGDYTSLICQICDKPFEVFLAKVRAKRGRKSGNTRQYIIRYYSREGEGEKRFTDYGGSDLDLRSGDIFYLCYKKLDKGPDLVCNDNINKFVEIKKSGCFIATATCGYNSIEVKTLSLFRDNILIKNIGGQLFTSNYYRFSPYLASYIEDKNILKRIIRKTLITPISLIFSTLFSLSTHDQIPHRADGKPIRSKP